MFSMGLLQPLPERYSRGVGRIKHVFDFCLTSNMCSAYFHHGSNARSVGRLLVMVVAAALLAGFFAGRATAGGDGVVRGHVYVVRAGDTVWAIAERVAGPGEDPRPVADRLIRDNAIQSGVIRPGDRLLVPERPGPSAP